MQSYRSMMQIVVLALLILQTSKVAELKTLIKRDSSLSSANHVQQSSELERVQVLSLRSPFIVLMSSNTVSVAQLPMIENGTLTDVYRLTAPPPDSRHDFYQENEGNGRSTDDDEPGSESGRDLEKEENEAEEEGKLRGIRRDSVLGADAREYEQQMPKPTAANINNTIASLGKSEWQQIASGASFSTSAARDREEVWPQTQAAPSSSASDRKESERALAHEEDETRPRRKRHARRIRRSNSLNDDEDGRRRGNQPDEAAGPSEDGPATNQQKQQQKQQQPGNYPDSQSIGVNRAKESSGSEAAIRNVTSAQFETSSGRGRGASNYERQTILRGGADSAASPGAPAEDDDKNRRSTHILDAASPGYSSAAILSRPPPASEVVDGVQFCDFDVHMLLGYAFVADSTGRIHRFKLPTVPSAQASTAGSRSDAAQKKTTSDEVQNDYTNTIDAGTNLERSSSSSQLPRHQLRANIAAARRSLNSTSTVDSSNNDIQTNDNHSIHDTFDDGARHDAATDQSHLLNANKVGRANFGDDTAPSEQLARTGERLHPTVSGEPSSSSLQSENENFGAPTSGSSYELLQQQQAMVNGAGISLSYNSKPMIIWSRNKFKEPPSTAAQRARKSFNIAASTSNAKSQQLANERGASPVQDGLKQQQVASGKHVSSADARQTNGEYSKLTADSESAAQRNRAKKRFLRTKIAVDWLNSLLFVLDKYRLVVVDFDGNNELLLIDDFNAITRPIDIKVDPANNFLFWLQAGRFHNTIYKLDLGVLAMPSAQQRLVGNAMKLRRSESRALAAAAAAAAVDPTRGGATTNDSESIAINGPGFDTSDLLALVSHHYAHPIITNLPRHTRLFTIDHVNSRIYVPLSPRPKLDSATQLEDEQLKRDDAEIFAPSDDATTHLNSTDISGVTPSDTDCKSEPVVANADLGQILAYNLDGTDVGPVRSVGINSHIASLDDLQDISLDAKNNLLYWLTSNGTELFEEYKEGTTIHPAQHNLDGRTYLSLIHFDGSGSNQPISQRPRFNLRKIIQMFSSSILPNRWTRSEGPEQFDDGIKASSLNVRQRDADATRFSRNAPYIILGATCLIVMTVYLMYTLIFQQMRATPNDNCNDACRSGSIDSASVGDSARSDGRETLNDGFSNSHWPAPGPSIQSTDTFNRALSSTTNGCQVGAYDLESSNYDASNAIDEHYRGDSTINRQTSNYGDDGLASFDAASATKLADIGSWPTKMFDVVNKLYVPVELLQDEELSSIRRIPLDQLEIEKKSPLGEGHFGTVLQGRVRCTLEEKTSLLNGTTYDGRLDQSQQLRFPPSSTSSGHGSSSSTSGDFITANSGVELTTNDDYLTPRNQLDISASDYTIDNVTGIAIAGSSGDADCENDQSKRINQSLSATTMVRVAIKKLKDNASSEEKRDFLQEAKLLANFNHPNIVHLIGICMDRGSTLIVMELMLGGDLIRYMQENTPKVVAQGADELTYDDQLKMCIDIVNGCCYLEELDYIHRDLAARNCLVSSRKRDERVVKLADFGLARDIYKYSYYKKLNDSAMPLKWMAPECLTEQKFTKKSDVWSFGVVMWEVMSYCQQKPYDRIEPMMLSIHLASGGRLRQPDNCDDNLYNLMSQCWQMEPEARPTFSECRATLIEIRNSRAIS